jgi:UPF0755 protein
MAFFFLPFTNFTDPYCRLYITKKDITKENLLIKLMQNECIKSETIFTMTGDLFKIWPKIKPGLYEIKKNENLFSIIRMFRNNKQKPVDLIITKLRTPDQLAAMIGRKFECDSIRFSQYISDTNFTQTYHLHSNQLFFITHPNTYTYYWSASPEDILQKLYTYHQDFWDKKRMLKAKTLGLTPLEVTTLASIVEEETLVNEEKSVIAGVYMNRLRKKMPLGADPTVKFATGDFTLKRIFIKHIKETAGSPYNTYTHTGLPPGPICTPMDNTIDAVLNASRHEFLFFCAAPDYSGRHKFAITDKQHLQNAKEYQNWLNQKGIR